MYIHIHTYNEDVLDVEKLDEYALLPNRKHSTDAGLDLYSLEHYEILPGQSKIIRTGITIKIPYNHFGFITNKSRNNFLVGGGIIDSGYQGEILVKIFNTNSFSDLLPIKLIIERRDAIAQLLIIPCIILPVVEKDNIHEKESDRGKSGGIAEQAMKKTTTVQGTFLDVLSSPEDKKIDEFFKENFNG